MTPADEGAAVERLHEAVRTASPSTGWHYPPAIADVVTVLAALEEAKRKVGKMIAETIVGYFDDQRQTKPAFDPGLGVPCPYCLKATLRPDNCRTTSLMGVGSQRSYFYRMHRTCDDAASDEEKDRIESAIIDSDPALRNERTDRVTT